MRLLLRLRPEYVVSVVGAQDTLGNWKEAEYGYMTEVSDGWELEKDRSELQFPLEYKYVLYNRKSKELIWQRGWNLYREQETEEIDDKDVSFDVEMPRIAGVAIPVFSLRTEYSSGVGEFEDLKEMVDFAVATGMHVIQTLPVNDTWMTGNESDTYPYNPLSVFSLNPLYIRMQSLIVQLTEMEQRQYEKERRQWNALRSYDYCGVLTFKMKWLRKVYETERKGLERKKSYRDFVKRSSGWLPSYAVFCVLRDRFGTSRFTDWKHELRRWSSEGVRKFLESEENRCEAAFYYYLQYRADEQLRNVHAYAQKRRVLLKGDLPIGVSPCGVDVWMHPELFIQSMSAGAPPDIFSERGQNWGFPTYDWDAMEEDGYAWWKARLQNMSQYFDAYRIDHVLGFFRIWSVPRTECWGLLGQFDKALPLSRAEIEQRGLRFDEARMLEPYVTEEMLEESFGERSSVLLTRYFERKGNGQLRFRKDFDSQMSIVEDFRRRGAEQSEKGALESLLRIRASVLFVRDRRDGESFHPRIALEHNASYEALDTAEKAAYEQIYYDFFYHRHETFWRDEAMRKLPVLVSATGMLACGEDLGMIPSCVSEVMQALQILSLEIQTMPKQDGCEFDDLSRVPYETVASPTTHDMAPLRLWWEEDAERSIRYYTHALHLSGNVPKEMCGELVKRVLCDFLRCPSIMVIAPIQDWMGVSEEIRRKDPGEERINVPDDADNIWNYRMHVSIENLMRNREFVTTLRTMIADSGRLESGVNAEIQ